MKGIGAHGAADSGPPAGTSRITGAYSPMGDLGAETRKTRDEQWGTVPERAGNRRRSIIRDISFEAVIEPPRQGTAVPTLARSAPRRGASTVAPDGDALPERGARLRAAVASTVNDTDPEFICPGLRIYVRYPANQTALSPKSQI
ncbi:hypothetical protein GCM10009799_40690 [Nocardiopsis rhodophaea]|uniref:Transposase n=1 Tax=Nocardiopsis rhodophaea TaxID=280238 RepID=A0ABP5EYX7_9ACTN